MKNKPGKVLFLGSVCVYYAGGQFVLASSTCLLKEAISIWSQTFKF